MLMLDWTGAFSLILVYLAYLICWVPLYIETNGFEICGIYPMLVGLFHEVKRHYTLQHNELTITHLLGTIFFPIQNLGHIW